ncbi:CD48 antigen isoform X2 [Larimichthys crocea]|uniref:CD48 antigen isoform X2 n=1 Tax=Larimichthys crocea TaxID=215358 RepID=UPI0009016C54|nr:CD48 antigen isoform X2 [Larimichthys crocea]
MELHKSIFLLFTVMISSDTVEVKKNLTGTEGGSITLPDPVKEFGFLSLGGKNLAMVIERRFQIIEEDYKDKVLWDNNTGLFTITGLQRNNSGIYIVDSKKVFTTAYKLTVYESVPAPAVNSVSVSAESCTLLCSVEKAGELLTLSWYKDEGIVIQNSSALSLLLTVHKQDFSSSYRCVAANPAEQKTVTVDVKTSCSEDNNKDNDGNPKRQYMVTYIIPIVCAVIIIFVAVIIKQKFFNKKKTTTTQGRFSEQRTGGAVY